jgi:hypothetical protein
MSLSEQDMLQRRTFLCWLLSGAAAMPLRGVRLHAQAAALPVDGIATLRAAAAVLLPSTLREAGHDKVVNDFVQWLASYRSGAERSWGYGAPRRSGTPTIDTSKYAAQLRAIEDRASASGGRLGALAAAARRQVLIEAIDQSGVRDLPSSPDGRHIVTDFMSFFFTSGPAYDLAYGARVARATCRGLGGGGSRPGGGD